MTFNKLVLLGGLSLAMAACNSSDTKRAEGNAANAANTLSLMGNTYTSECTNLKLDLFKFAAQEVQYSIDGSGEGIRRITTYFNANNCEQPVMKIEELGAYSNLTKTENDNSFIDIQWKNVQVTPIDETVLAAMNLGYCGITDWARMGTRDVTAAAGSTTCPATIKTPSSQYDLIHTSENVITLGRADEEHDKTTPEKRPIEIEKNVVYTIKK